MKSKNNKPNLLEDNKFNPLEELPFFESKKLSAETDENKNGPIPLKPLSLGL